MVLTDDIANCFTVRLSINRNAAAGCKCGFVCGFGVSQYRVNRIRVSDLWLTTRPAVAWLVRMTMTGADLWLVGGRW